METCLARFAVKNPNSKTTDVSFGGIIQIQRLRFVNKFSSKIEIRLKTENGFKKVANLTTQRRLNSSFLFVSSIFKQGRYDGYAIKGVKDCSTKTDEIVNQKNVIDFFSSKFVGVFFE